MSILDQSWFSNITKPSRYIGNEINSIQKEPAHTEVSVVLAFPDIYEVGMSHLGMKIIYNILNNQHWLAAERVFSPWVDLEEELRRNKIPLATLESGRPLANFDIIGFSLQHELSYTNVLNMLDLSGIPFLATERDEDSPLIIAGGPVCFNPEPIAEIFDAIVIGDGEEVSLKICREVRKVKKHKTIQKRELLNKLCHTKGVYVPSLFSVNYRNDGPIDIIEPIDPGYRIVEKAILPNIDDFPFPEQQIVPFTELVHDRVVIEIARGCTRGCRFCQAGMIYRPVRERSPESIIEKAANALKLTGFDDLSLLSLSSGDYSRIESLMMALMNKQAREKIAVSLPSLRVDSLNPSLIKQIKRVRKTGFTLAPEAGNDRLRRVINKGLTQKEILDTAFVIYNSGWNMIKLYFMIGLPLEEEKDLQDIIDLAKQVVSIKGKKGGKPSLHVGISTFVPKSHTPFMWESQISLAESRRRIQFIREGLSNSPVRIKYNQPELSWLEGIFSRGDRRLVSPLIEAWSLGARFDGWGEHFRMGIWEEAFRHTGVDPDFYLYRKRPLNEVLPWDHISSGVTKSYFTRERKKAQEEQLTPDCRNQCLKCGVCDHKTVDPVLFRDSKFIPEPETEKIQGVSGPTTKYRLGFSKLGHAGYLSHLELVRVFTRAFNRAGLKLVFSKGFHPMPKVSFGCALPVGTESMQETVEIELMEISDASLLMEIINRQLPSGITVNSITDISNNKKKERLKESRFLVMLKGVKLNKDDLEKFLCSDYFPVVKTRKKGAIEVNARPLVKSMSLISPDRVKITIQHISGPELKPAEIIKNVFLLKGYNINNMKVLKTCQVIA